MAKKRFFPALLLTLVLALSPLSAFAESGAYAVKFYPGDYGTMTKNDQIPFVYCITALTMMLTSPTTTS